MDFEQAKKWFNSLFGRQRAWSYEEDQLLSQLLPIEKGDRDLLSWAYTLPRDAEGWALVGSDKLSKRKQSLVSLLREFASELDKWRSVRVGQKKNNTAIKAEVLPPKWADMMKKIYGADVPIPQFKSQVTPSARDEIEAAIATEDAV